MRTIDLEFVHVQPAVLVKPADPAQFHDEDMITGSSNGRGAVTVAPCTMGSPPRLRAMSRVCGATLRSMVIPSGSPQQRVPTRRRHTGFPDGIITVSAELLRCVEISFQPSTIGFPTAFHGIGERLT